MVGRLCVVGWGRNSYLGPAEIASFSSLDLSRRGKNDSLWFDASTGYFYVYFCIYCIFFL